MIIYNEKTGHSKDVRLPKKFKEKWIAALRSGKFKQGMGWLEDDGKYCCLGVACRIAHPKLDLNDASFITKYSFPGGRIDKIKIPAILKGEDENEVVSVLASKNDNGQSFKKIATWIEKNL